MSDSETFLSNLDALVATVMGEFATIVIGPTVSPAEVYYNEDFDLLSPTPEDIQSGRLVSRDDSREVDLARPSSFAFFKGPPPRPLLQIRKESRYGFSWIRSGR